MSATGVRAMLDAFGRLGLDPRRIERGAGLAPGGLADPDRQLFAPRVYAMWEVADRLWGRPGLGLFAGRAVPIGAYEVLDYLLLASHTLGDGLTSFASYFGVATHTARYDITQEGELFACEMIWLIPPSGVMFHLRDYSLSALTHRAFEASGHRPVRVELAGPPLAPASDYDEVFGAPTALRADRSAMVFSSRAWQAPQPRSDEYLRRTLRRHADHLLERSAGAGAETVGQRVRAELLRRVRIGMPPIEEVARTLGVGPRTLQRQLKEEGLCFATLAEEVRARLAGEYLNDPALTISEISYLLGFSEPSAFSRAFRRWTGRSPQAFRSGAV
jgi:AraC-like DNA-binding protein